MKRIHRSPFVVGLTGGIGAGKSTIVNHLEDLDIPVFDCDAAVHELYRDEGIVAQLTELYGPMGPHPRERMAQLAWNDPQVRKTVEAIFIPQVTLRIMSFIDRHVALERKLVVIDAPTLMEHNLDTMMDWIVSVDVPASERFDRIRGRHGMTAEKFNNVLKAQVSDEERRRRSHSIIFNDGTLEAAQQKTTMLFRQLQRITRA